MIRHAIGNKVLVSELAGMGYDEEGNRCLFTDKIEPREAVVVGGVHRRKGTYNPATGNGEDYEPPYLAITGTVYLTQVRFTPTGRIHDVRPESIEVL